MTLEELKILHAKFSKLPLPKDIWESQEYAKYIDAYHENEEFNNWMLTTKFQNAMFTYQEYCCLEMADKIFESKDENGEIKHDDPDVIMNKWENGSYGIPIHDGGTSMIVIKYCPWCGQNLKCNK